MKNKNFFIWNLIFFSILILIVSFHYYNNYINLKREIFSLVKNEAESIAKRFEVAATKLYRSNKFIKSTIKNNLKSQAKFIDLLNSIEEFKNEELTEFAKETGLHLIYIYSLDKNKITSYYNRLKIDKNIQKIIQTKINDKLLLYSKNNLIIYYYKGIYSKAYIITGIISKKYFQAQKRFTTSNLIKSIVKHRKEVLGIKILENNIKRLTVNLINNKYFLVKLPFQGIPGKSLEIKIDATHGVKIIDNFKHNLLIFLIFILITGIIVILLIYNIQKKYLEAIKEYEKKIFRQEKDAALGRSAALIAHEIRNPVNAVNMGLQRIQYETNIDKNKEYADLIYIMRNELSKINKTIENFIDYTKPLEIIKEDINLYYFLKDIITLFKKSSINIELKIPEKLNISGDKKFLFNAFSNLIKNSVENNSTKHLKIFFYNNELIFENDGITEKPDTEKIFEPYYTTKTRGSGLGLPIVKKIIEAHKWRIYCNAKNDKIEFKIIF